MLSNWGGGGGDNYLDGEKAPVDVSNSSEQMKDDDDYHQYQHLHHDHADIGGGENDDCLFKFNDIMR